MLQGSHELPIAVSNILCVDVALSFYGERFCSSHPIFSKESHDSRKA